MVFKFFHLVVIIIFEDKILMYIALNIAESSLRPLVICFLGFPLAVRASQAGFLSRLRITNGFSLAAWGICLYNGPAKSAKGIHKRLKGSCL
jgi:hypothetical protein